jgi:hypothetical protein
MKLLRLLATLPLLYFPHGIDRAPTLRQAGIEQICVPPEQASEWNKAGFKATPMSQAELEARTRLITPRIALRAGVASPTRSPWIDANGWQFLRNSAGRFYYDLPPGRAVLAAAEAFAYSADAVLKIDPADLAEFGRMLAFLREIPETNLPAVADFAVIDDGSSLTGEVLNLLARRNLLFRVVAEPAPQFGLTIRLGTKGYLREDAADPNAFALKVRRQLGDDKRSLRIYGSETVICRLTSDGKRTRLHLLNYSGREIEGLRVKVRGTYNKGAARVFGADRMELTDDLTTDGATEFSIPRLGIYAVVDLMTK